MGLYIFAKMKVNKGEQLNWHYGNKGNHAFLKNYGFVLNDNSQKAEFLFRIQLEVDDNKDPTAAIKRDIISQYRAISTFWINENPNSKEHEFMQLWSLYRILLFSDFDRP